MSEALVILSNLAVAAVTGLLIIITVRDGQHHEERMAHEADLLAEKLHERELADPVPPTTDH